MSKLQSLLASFAAAMSVCWMVNAGAAAARAEEPCAGGVCEVPNISADERSLIDRERQQLWKAIKWQGTATSALQQSKIEGKPLLVVLSVGQRGRANVPDT